MRELRKKEQGVQELVEKMKIAETDEKEKL